MTSTVGTVKLNLSEVTIRAGRRWTRVVNCPKHFHLCFPMVNSFRDLVLRKRATLLKRYVGSSATVGGTIAEIYETMDASFRNMFQDMYRSIVKGRTCEWCGTCENLNRCHTGKDRPTIAREAIVGTPCIGPDGLRSRADIMILFVSLHEDQPVKIMCRECHRKYDKIKLGH